MRIYQYNDGSGSLEHITAAVVANVFWWGCSDQKEDVQEWLMECSRHYCLDEECTYHNAEAVRQKLLSGDLEPVWTDEPEPVADFEVGDVLDCDELDGDQATVVTPGSHYVVVETDLGTRWHVWQPSVEVKVISRAADVLPPCPICKYNVGAAHNYNLSGMWRVRCGCGHINVFGDTKEEAEGNWRKVCAS